MNRLQASALVLLLWAMIYLPGLGSTELKGEEGRRILPAVTMLETGNWLVPYIGGKPYLRKPPLVNWAIAGMFKLTGVRNEWTARLPSALCVLALGLTIVATSGAGWIQPGTAFVAAVMAMTQFGLLAKARFAGAEIEGIYAPITGMAMVCWLAWWMQRRSPWLTWLVPGALLGVACLAKGPSLHLLFFYVLAAGVVIAAREWRRLLHPAPFVGLALTAAIFAGWWVPYKKMPGTERAEEVLKRQGIDRFTENEFNAGNYVANIPRALGDQLPWVLLVPLLVVAVRRRLGAGDSRCDAAMRGAAWAVSGVFVVVLLVPGTLPRYVLPLGAPIALLLAWAIEAVPLGERGTAWWHRVNQFGAGLVMLLTLLAPLAAGIALGTSSVGEALRSFDLRAALFAGLASAPVLALGAVLLARRALSLTPAALACASAALIGAGTILYTTGAVRWINSRDDLRPLARAIDAAMPAGKPLFIYDPGYMAAVFYLRTPVRYAPTTEGITPDAEWVLARAKARQRLSEKQPEFVVAQVLKGGRGEEFLLLQRHGEAQKLPAR
jgi:4-amino-4-deoxy-L-arabinose transferase-like glycosyltransferase